MDNKAGMAWQKVAESEGDYLWVYGNPSDPMSKAVIQAETPTDDQIASAKILPSVIVQLDVEEWNWF